MNRRIHITVDVDALLAEGFSDTLRERLARGLRVSTCYRGVRVDGLPKQSMIGPSIFRSSTDADAALRKYAAASEDVATRAGGSSTATGRWLLDHAAFYRLAAVELLRRRASLWPAEVA